MIKQNAGRNKLSDLAPKFAELNDDVLFGEIWSRVDKLSLRDRSIITVVALMGKGITDDSIKYHINNARLHGVSKTEMVEIITHLAFYIGWPNDWQIFPIVKEIYKEDKNEPSDSLFGLGELNTKFAPYFIGNSYLKPLNIKDLSIFNVTFEPKCRNNWHIHHKGGQILLCTDGEGWYQEAGKKAIKLIPGTIVYIAPEIKHWHGATKDSWFTHIAIEIPVQGSSSEWCEKVEDKEYFSL